MVRSIGRVECNATDLYALLVAKEGYKLVDPDADASEFDKPLLGPFAFEGKGDRGSGGKVQLEHATLKVPRLWQMGTREI